MKLHDLFGSTITACGCAAVAARAAALAVLLSAAHLAQAQTVAGPNKFIPTFLVYYGGGPTLVASDAAKLAKFDLLDIDRFRYNQIGPNTWAAVKAVNPNIEIYLYEDGPEAQNYMDALPQISINGMGRHNVSRGHSMGSLNGNHPELFLLDSSGNRIYNAGFSNVAANQFWYLMDFGSPTYQAYWVEGVKADIIDQPWVADGVHADLCVTFGAPAGENAVPVKYPTDAVWSVAMNNFARAITAGLHTHGQKLWCNKGSTTSTAGVASWVALDSGANPPDVMAEEGAFAVAFGPWSTQFVPEALWKNQVDVMSAVTNTKVAMFSHTALGEGQSGTDNWGLPVSYWQTLWYSLGSFLLGKNDTLNNAYFFFSGNGEALNRIWWYDEYDKIDLGKALGPYAVTTIGGVNIYSREFERGYVLVNPTPSNVASITIPQASRQLTHGNLLSPLDSIPTVTAIPLSAHNATILVKAVVVPPLPRRRVAGDAGSGHQLSEHRPRRVHHLLLHRPGHRRRGQRLGPVGRRERDNANPCRCHRTVHPGRAHRLRDLFFTDQPVVDRIHRQRRRHRVPPLPRQRPAGDAGNGHQLSEHQPRRVHHLLLHRPGHRRRGQRLGPVGRRERDNANPCRCHRTVHSGRAHRLRDLFFTDQPVVDRIHRQRRRHRVPRLPRRRVAGDAGNGHQLSEHQPRRVHHLLLHRPGHRRRGQRLGPVGRRERDNANPCRCHRTVHPGRAHRLRDLFFTDQPVVDRIHRQRRRHRVPRLPRRRVAGDAGNGHQLSEH